MDKRYYIKSGSYCYPHQTSKPIKDWGVLEEYVGTHYTRDDMDKIICELILRHPYISGAMYIEVIIAWSDGKASGFYHDLRFRQEPSDYFHQAKDAVVKFKKLTAKRSLYEE